ncbi:MAG: DUF2065 domain-containing protein [Rhodobacteraceae bacterium]|nr:DUF2065 domain-containing protein [Paracoccaceae bacterium]
MATVVLALGLVMIVEGLVWVLAPSLVERLLEALRDMPEAQRRQVGALVLVTGFLLLWGAHQLGATL